MNIEQKFKLAYDKIKEAKNILFITHERPDGDAFSSVCAMSLLVERMQKKYSTFCYNQPSFLFNYIPNIEKVKNDKNLDWKSFDLIIVFDCGSLSRTRLEKEINSLTSNQYIIEFDHHTKTDDYSDLEIRIPELSSTAELIYKFFKANNIKFDKNIATCILSGILTDTINFINTTTSADTISASSEMLEAGAQMPKINRFAWKNKNIHSMKVLGHILDNLKINKKYNFAFTCLTLKEMESLGETEETFDSVINFLSNIDDVKAVMLIREEKLGKIKGSFRTNHPSVNVSKLASLTGGGGHARAAGFKVEGHIIKTKKSWKIV